MATPNVLVLSGYGINCEEETQHAFELAGARGRILHVNDLIVSPGLLSEYQIFAFPGGFSYGDDTGAGNALANKMKSRLGEHLSQFIADEKLAIGICNGFQVLVNLGLISNLEGNATREAALIHNDNARYTDRWVDLQFQQGRTRSPWTQGLDKMRVPIAHGEGKFYATPETLSRMNVQGLVAARYFEGEVCKMQGYPANPNGSLENIAAATDPTGRVLGIMPHPERAIRFTHLPYWTLLKEQLRRAGQPIPEYGDGLAIFQNAVKYFT